MNTMLMTTTECRKEQQKRACKQRAIVMPLRNSGDLRKYHLCMIAP